MKISMDEFQSIELLEATHDFPGRYMFKVIGRVENGFQARVVAAVREVMAIETDPPHRTRHTAGGRHVAITLEPEMETAWQVLAIYRRIRDIPGVVMLW